MEFMFGIITGYLICILLGNQISSRIGYWISKLRDKISKK